jgi:hypothetical protein
MACMARTACMGRQVIARQTYLKIDCCANNTNKLLPCQDGYRKTAMHVCTARTVLHCNAVQCTALYAPQRTALQCITSHCTALHCNAMQCTVSLPVRHRTCTAKKNLYHQ